MKTNSKILIFYLALGGCILLAGLVKLSGRILAGHAGSSAEAGKAGSYLRWLLTNEGERRGFAIISDLTRDGEAWELWGSNREMSALNPIADLRPGDFFNNSGFGFNGGYWDEFRQPVGVCAGERGIHGARSHTGGFALAGGRAWIGPLTAHARLTALKALDRPGEKNAAEMAQAGKTRGGIMRAYAAREGSLPELLKVPAQGAMPYGKVEPDAGWEAVAGLVSDAKKTMATMEVMLNPRPLSRHGASLIDLAAFAGEVKTEGPVLVAWLEKPNRDPLRFNTTLRLQVSKVFHHAGGGMRLPEPADGVLELVLPEKLKGNAEPEPRVGDRYRLSLTLEPVQGVVQLATSAGPRLLKEGKIPEALARTSDSRAERTWRTVIGCDATGHRLVALMLARGRDGLPGVTLREAAETLRELGATEGINLDGGSSSTVWYRHLKSELKPLFPLQSEIQHAIFVRKDLPVVTTQP